MVTSAIVNRLNKSGKRIVRCGAPTGVAGKCFNDINQCYCHQECLAYNMNGGSTLHQLLALPVQHGKTGEFEALTPGKQKALQLAWFDTALLVSYLIDCALILIE